MTQSADTLEEEPLSVSPGAKGLQVRVKGTVWRRNWIEAGKTQVRHLWPSASNRPYWAWILEARSLDPSLKGVRTASLLLSVIVVKRTRCFPRARPCAEYELGQIFLNLGPLGLS